MRAYVVFFFTMKIVLLIQFVLILFKKQTKNSKIYILTEIIFKTTLFLFIEWFTFHNNFGIDFDDKLIISFGGGLLFYDACFNDAPRLIEQINNDKNLILPDWIRNILNYFGANIQKLKTFGDR